MSQKDFMSAEEYYECHRRAVERFRKEQEEFYEKNPELSPKEKKPMTQKEFYGDCDHPDTMEDSTATILYIVVMLGALIFTDRVLIWIAATIIYFCFRNRHKMKK